MKFEKKITIGHGFKRSINLIQDRNDIDVLEHYICPPSSEQVIQSIAQHISTNSQSAFTWTGPYGSGKSSLAIFTSALAAGNSESYKLAASKLHHHKKNILELFRASDQRTIIPIVGTPEDPIEVLSKALKVKNTSQAILSKLEKISKKESGIILFVDEMGKFLEKASNDTSIDVYLFQQLAELANRSDGKFIFIGILHQSIAEYSRNLPKTARDEWIKIQGRFIDLAVNAAGEEQIDLISRSIISSEKPKKITEVSKSVANLISKNRPVDGGLLSKSLNACWPLHPIVASLLGPVSRRRFGQNQRSLFSFLSSAEPYGFQFFLKQEEFAKNTFYTPSLYWEYLKTNFEGSILASSDAKIWTVANEAINKCSVSCSEELAQEVMKTISVIDLFKGASGLAVTNDILKSVFPNINLNKILEELKSLSLIRENRFTDSYSLFEGSDFNIDEELSEAYKHITDIDFQKLNQIASFKPIVAKRHYHKTGVMRWMDVQLIPTNSLNSRLDEKTTSAFGEFLIVIPRNKSESIESQEAVFRALNKDENFPRIIGVSDSYQQLLDFSRELLALEWLKKNASSLSGDKIARAEVDNRHALVSNLFSRLLERTLIQTNWVNNGKKLGNLTDRKMSSLSSDLADNLFNNTPLLKTEMLNRHKPSSNANAALNTLLKRMVFNNGEDRLGIEGFPAEGGIYKILLEDTGIYSLNKKKWQYSSPINDVSNINGIWKHTDTLLVDKRANLGLKDIYAEWEKPPFGIKKGLHAFLMTSYLLAKKGHVAVYLNGTYIPEVDDLFIDYLIKNTAEISLRYVTNDQKNQKILKRLLATLTKDNPLKLKLSKDSSPLDLAKELVSLVDKLNPWVLRTRSLPQITTKLRELLKAAHDPNKLIFDDLPKLFNLKENDIGSIEGLVDSLNELLNAYPQLLKKLGQKILDELQVDGSTKSDLEKLQKRANNIKQASGDFRIDALAARLTTFGKTDNDVAGIASLAANKPIHDWIDLDLERASIEISVLCQGFKKAELYARVEGKEPQRHAIALTTGLSGHDTVHQLSFDVLEDHKPKIENIRRQIENSIKDEVNPELVLAAITEISIEYMELLNINKKRAAE